MGSDNSKRKAIRQRHHAFRNIHFTARLLGLALGGLFFTTLGVLTAINGILFGGALMIGLVIISALDVVTSPTPTFTVRGATNNRVICGESVEFQCELANTRSRHSGEVRVIDASPTSRRKHFRLPPIPPHTVHGMTLATSFDQRGVVGLGPLYVETIGVFNLCFRSTRVVTEPSITVWPRIVALRTNESPTPRSLSAQESGSVASRRGGAILSMREYQRGDDFRKIHWRASARFGKPISVVEGQAAEEHVVVALDHRRDRYAGGEIGDHEFELAVCTAASLVQAMEFAGVPCVLTNERGAISVDYSHGAPLATTEHMLDYLSTVNMTDASLDGRRVTNQSQLIWSVGGTTSIDVPRPFASTPMVTFLTSSATHGQLTPNSEQPHPNTVEVRIADLEALGGVDVDTLANSAHAASRSQV